MTRFTGPVAKWAWDGRVWLIVSAITVAAVLGVPDFATSTNISLLMVQAAPDALVTVGMTILLITGMVDLSVGAIMAMAGLVYGYASSFGIPEGVALGIITGCGMGAVNGALVSRLRVNFFIATLATMTAFQGLALGITGGNSVYNARAGFTWLGSTTVSVATFPIGVSVLIVAVCALCAHVFLSMTAPGRYVYAIGSNTQASVRAGIAVRRMIVSVFVISGAFAGLGGVLLASASSNSSPDVGGTVALVAIAATILGGTSIYGGIGSIGNAFAGIALIVIMDNCMNLLVLPPYYQYVLQGMVLIWVVVVDARSSRRASGQAGTVMMTALAGPRF